MPLTSPLAVDVNSRAVQNVPLEGETVYEYDASNNLIRETTTLRGGFSYRTEYEYDINNNCVKSVTTRTV